MKSKVLLSLSTAVVTVSAFIFAASCSKSNSNSANNYSYTADHVLLEKSFDDAQSIVDEAAATVTGGSLSTYRTTATYPKIVNDTIDNIVSVDFGPTDILGKDGVSRRGAVTVTYSKDTKYRDAGSVHTITFNKFYHNDNQLLGSKIITNMGNNLYGQPYFSITTSGSIELADSAGLISWNCARTRTWVTGFTTLGDCTDDSYQLTGHSTITRADHSVISADITQSLVTSVGCRWIEKGIVKYTLIDGSTSTIDFGVGNCDAQATLTVNGIAHNIIMQ